MASPSVTALSVPPPLSTVPSELTTVPPVMVPLNEFRPPAPATPLLPNTPAAPMSSTWPVLLSVPEMLTVVPVARVKLPSVAVERLPPRLSVPPAVTASVPLLLPLAPDSVSVPPVALSAPVLLQVAAARFSVPVLLAFSVPVLLKTPGLMNSVWPAMLALMVPALLMVDSELWVTLPLPCNVMPLAMLSVWGPPKPAKILPPAMLTVALPAAVDRLAVPPPWNSHCPLPMLAVTPAPSVRPLLMKTFPLDVSVGWLASPSTTLSSVPPPDTAKSLTTVAFWMVPVSAVAAFKVSFPPLALNGPAILFAPPLAAFEFAFSTRFSLPAPVAPIAVLILMLRCAESVSETSLALLVLIALLMEMSPA